MNEVTPIVVNGVMYLPAGNRVVALDPDTGAEVWRYELKTGAASQRGVAYWPGDKDNPRAHPLHRRPQDGGAEREDRQARSGLRQ